MKKRVYVVIILLFVIFPLNVEAKKGCCSHHGGVLGCSSSGRQVCNDKTLSPSCTCTPSYRYGCTDKFAKNYNPNATKSDGSCTYYVSGCTDSDSVNYNSEAEKDNGSCIKKILGCNDETALNYNKSANVNDHSCQYKKENNAPSSMKNEETNNVKEIENNSDSPAVKHNIGAEFFGFSVIGVSVYILYKLSKKLKTLL